MQMNAAAPLIVWRTNDARTTRQTRGTSARVIQDSVWSMVAAWYPTARRIHLSAT